MADHEEPIKAELEEDFQADAAETRAEADRRASETITQQRLGHPSDEEMEEAYLTLAHGYLQAANEYFGKYQRIHARRVGRPRQ